jgi:hypothetical protein
MLPDVLVFEKVLGNHPKQGEDDPKNGSGMNEERSSCKFFPGSLFSRKGLSFDGIYIPDGGENGSEETEKDKKIPEFTREKVFTDVLYIHERNQSGLLASGLLYLEGHFIRILEA